MVAIEHRQKSAIITTDIASTTPTVISTSSSLSSSAATTTSTATIETLAAVAATTSSTSRRSSDIINSNDIAIISSATSTAATATSNIIYVTPKDSINQGETDLENELLSSIKLNRSPAKMSQSSSEASTATAESSAVSATRQKLEELKIEPTVSKSAVSQRNVDIKIANKPNKDTASATATTTATNELTKNVLKLDLAGKDLDEFSIKSPRSPIATRLPHQTSLTTVDVEDRKTLREALYQGIFHRHRRTIFAVGSFLRMLRSRNSSYNTIRSSSEGEDVGEDETR